MNMCNPCKLTSPIFINGCKTQSVNIDITDFVTNSIEYQSILSTVLNNYLLTNSLNINNCQLNGMTTVWFVNIIIDDVVTYNSPYFSGTGYYEVSSKPSSTTTTDAILDGFDFLTTLGYEYFISEDLKTITLLYNQTCVPFIYGIDFKLDIGINFNLTCN